MKIAVAFAFVLILASLGSALFHMLRRKDKADARMVKSLALRVGLSVLLFIALLVANQLGYIQPTGLR